MAEQPNSFMVRTTSDLRISMALVTPGCPAAQALEAMTDCRGWWCERVFAAFWRVVAGEHERREDRWSEAPD